MKRLNGLNETTRCAIFDLDGTLLDSLGAWAEIDKVFLGQRGITDVPDDYELAIGHMKEPEAAQYTIELFSLSETVDEIIHGWDVLGKDIYYRLVYLKPGAKEYLYYLHQNGIRLTIATAGNPNHFLPVLNREGITDLFEGYTTLSEVTRGKGSPDIFFRTAEKAGFSPGECCVFEDNYLAICAAREGGFRTVAVYDPLRSSQWDSIRGVADLMIDNFLELLPQDL